MTGSISRQNARTLGAGLFSVLTIGGAATSASAQTLDASVYGFAQVDYIQDFNRVAPNWEDTLRPSRIPTIDGFYGDDGNAVIGVRQSRLGAQATQHVGGNDLFVKVEFDFFGVGSNEGKVTPRLRHAYGSWGQILAGQTHTLFMDIDTFPNVVDYWGPAGMVFIRNPQIRWTFLNGDHHSAAVAIEHPSDDVDAGEIRALDPDLGAAITAHDDVPDLTAQYRYKGDWGHVQAAGVLRQIGFETVGAPGNEPSDDKLGWGVDLTSNIKFGSKDKLIFGFVFGEGIASYMNDGGTDLAPGVGDGIAGLAAKAVPLQGLNLYYDHYWNDTLSSSVGYSRTQVSNTAFQSPDAFKNGEYASVNLLYTPAENILFGGELLYGAREDMDGSSGEDVRLQFSAKYSFNADI